MDDTSEATSGLYRGPAGEALRFFTRPLKNNFISEKLGRPVFDTGLFVEIITPGSTASAPEKLLELTLSEEAGKEKGARKTQRKADYERFKAQVEAFKANTGEYAVNGMPLTQWTQIDVGTAQTLRAQGVHTVEQLAEVQDVHLTNLGMGGRHLREQAKAWITARQFGIPVAQQTAETSTLREENARLTAENTELKRLLAESTQRVEALSSGLGAGLDNTGPQFDPFANQDGANAVTPTDAGAADEAAKSEVI